MSPSLQNLLIYGPILIALVALALIPVVRWWQNREPEEAAPPLTTPEAPIDPLAGIVDGFPLNSSLFSPIPGALVVFVIMLLGGWLGLGWLGNRWPFVTAKILIAILPAVAYYAICLQPSTQAGYRGIGYFFGQRRFRLGPDGLGLLEGPNATALPRGIITIKDEDVRERTMDLGTIEEYSLNDVVVKVAGSMQWQIIDGAEWKSLADGETAVKNVVFPAFRDVMMEHYSHGAKRNGADTKGIIDENKEEFSEKILQRIRRVLEENARDSSKQTRITSKLVRVNSVQAKEIRLPKEMDTALTQREVEPVEREAGLIQAETRRLQIEKLKTRPDGTVTEDIDDSTALSVMLVDDEKTGAENINLTVGKAITDAVKDSAGGGSLDLNMLLRLLTNRGGRGGKGK